MSNELTVSNVDDFGTELSFADDTMFDFFTEEVKSFGPNRVVDMADGVINFKLSGEKNPVGDPVLNAEFLIVGIPKGVSQRFFSRKFVQGEKNYPPVCVAGPGFAAELKPAECSALPQAKNCAGCSHYAIGRTNGADPSTRTCHTITNLAVVLYNDFLTMDNPPIYLLELTRSSLAISPTPSTVNPRGVLANSADARMRYGWIAVTGTLMKKFSHGGRQMTPQAFVFSVTPNKRKGVQFQPVEYLPENIELATKFQKFVQSNQEEIQAITHYQTEGKYKMSPLSEEILSIARADLGILPAAEGTFSGTKDDTPIKSETPPDSVTPPATRPKAKVDLSVM